MMARIQGIKRGGSVLTRLIYLLSRRSYGRVIHLAQVRLARFGSRVTVEQTEGSLQFEAASGSYDRFVSTYVADLLSASDITTLLAEAHRLLVPEGRLCLVSLTHGTRWLSRLVTGLWTGIHRLMPMLVGGCRPLDPGVLLPAHTFHLEYIHVVTAFDIPSEVIVAKPLKGRAS
jgi:hypothetical protein